MKQKRFKEDRNVFNLKAENSRKCRIANSSFISNYINKYS